MLMLAIPTDRPNPPARKRCGLGLLDVMLAVSVLSVMALWGGQIAGDWIADRTMAGEARTVSDLAAAGRLLVEGDIAHAGRTHGVNAAPLQVGLADLAAAGLRSPVAGDRTPGRRALTLWLWRPNQGALVIIARARGETPLPRLPGAEDGVTGVGAVLGTQTVIRGAGVDFDMAPVNTVVPGFATREDLFGFDYVALDIPCRSYLFREPVQGCVAANRMTVDLDMGNNNIVDADNIAATTADIGTLTGATTVAGALTIDGDLEVNGASTVENLTARGTVTADNVDVADGLTVPGDLVATGTITGAELTFTGALTVSGTARLGDADVDTLNVESLNVGQLGADRATITAIFADDVTVSRCTGCTR